MHPPDLLPGHEVARSLGRRLQLTRQLGQFIVRVAFLAGFDGRIHIRVANSTRRQDYANVGAQVDLKFSVLHWYDMTLSAGYAVGFQGGKRAGSEWMISLKIM